MKTTSACWPGAGTRFYEEELHRHSSGNMRQWPGQQAPLLDARARSKISSPSRSISATQRGELEMRKAKDAAESALRICGKPEFADPSGEA